MWDSDEYSSFGSGIGGMFLRDTGGSGGRSPMFEWKVSCTKCGRKITIEGDTLAEVENKEKWITCGECN